MAIKAEFFRQTETQQNKLNEVEKKMRGLSKRVKAELELQSGQLQVEIEKIQASDEDRLARIV